MDKFAVVTGGGTGLGRALAVMLAQHDCHVLIVGRRIELLKETQALAPKQIQYVCADVATVDGRQQIVAALPGEKLHFLIHNAAVITPIKPIEVITLAEWQKIQAINVEGPLFLTQALLSKLQGGRVLHISSGAAHHAIPGWSAYCTSKAALHMLYQNWRAEWSEQICFASVRPGIVDTAMQAEIRDPANPFENREFFAEKKRQGELHSPELVARFIEWLLFSVDDKMLSQQEWDVRDSEHQTHWNQ